MLVHKMPTKTKTKQPPQSGWALRRNSMVQILFAVAFVCLWIWAAKCQMNIRVSDGAWERRQTRASAYDAYASAPKPRRPLLVSKSAKIGPEQHAEC